MKRGGCPQGNFLTGIIVLRWVVLLVGSNQRGNCPRG